jgi:hypothetical protein
MFTEKDHQGNTTFTERSLRHNQATSAGNPEGKVYFILLDMNCKF